MSQTKSNHEIVTTALIALGSNLESGGLRSDEILAVALSQLHGESVSVLQASRLYHSPAFPAGSGPDYVNAAAAVSTVLSPRALLDRLHAVERHMGRERRGRWGARVIDLDLLACADAVLPDVSTFEHWRRLAPEDQRRLAPERMILPHPRLHERAFVLLPLAEIAPHWHHPVLGMSVAEMAAALTDAARAGIAPLPGQEPGEAPA